MSKAPSMGEIVRSLWHPDAPKGLIAVRSDSGGVTATWTGSQKVTTRLLWHELERIGSLDEQAGFVELCLRIDVWNALNPTAQVARPMAPAPSPTSMPSVPAAAPAPNAGAVAVVDAPTKIETLTTAILESRGPLRVAPIPPLPAFGPLVAYDLDALDDWADKYGLSRSVNELTDTARAYDDLNERFGVVEELHKDALVALRAITPTDNKTMMLKAIQEAVEILSKAENA